jgi:small nuclear ribonucleoprotein (snRNP)-like protein
MMIHTLDSITEKLLVVLRDGRKLIGILRSFDQFGESLEVVEEVE